MNYFWSGPVNTNWGPGPVNTNWGPRTGLGPGASDRAGGQIKGHGPGNTKTQHKETF